MSESKDINKAMDSSVPTAQHWLSLLDQLSQHPEEVDSIVVNYAFWNMFSSNISSNLDGKTWHAMWQQRKVDAQKKRHAIDIGLRKIPLHVIDLKTMDLVDRNKRKLNQKQVGFQNSNVSHCPADQFFSNKTNEDEELPNDNQQDNCLNEFVVQAKSRISFGSPNINMERNPYKDVVDMLKEGNEALRFNLRVSFDQYGNIFKEEIASFTRRLLLTDKKQ